MDWPKAKNILIVGLLLLDIYLAYLLFYLPGAGAMQTTVTGADLEALIVLSQNFNVDLVARPQPMSVRPLPLLAIDEVSLDETMAEQLATRWLGQEFAEAKQENGLLFTAGQKQLLLSQSSPYFYTVSYQDDSALPNEENHTLQQAMDRAQDFLVEFLGETAALDYQINMSVAVPDTDASYIIEISRSHNGVPIFLDSYRLLVQQGAIVSFTAKQAEIGEAQRTTLPLVSAEQVVRRYLARLGVEQAEQIVVLDLRLGYGVGIHASARHEIEPVWRFLLGGDVEENEVIIPAAQIYWQKQVQ